mgnify:CR=1 FL=1
MASVTKKPNGTYLVRVSAGKDDYGRQITVSRTFTPSRPNLSYASLQKEIGIFTDSLESQILSGDILRPDGKKIEPNDPGKMLFKDFCPKFLEIKKNEIAPGTLAFYKKTIDEHLIPTYVMPSTIHPHRKLPPFQNRRYSVYIASDL